jgi:hypothetical protein
VTEREFARGIIKLAAKQATTRYVREWFVRDEFGTWEGEALACLAEVRGRPYSREFIVEQIALRLRYLANTAVLTKGA